MARAWGALLCVFLLGGLPPFCFRSFAGGMPGMAPIALASVEESETRSVMPPVPERVVWLYARGRAWLSALARAQALLPERRDIALGVPPAKRLALIAQIYHADIPPHTGTDDADGHEEVRLPLRLLPRQEAAMRLDAALRNPCLLLLRQLLIDATQGVLAGMDQHWPGAPPDGGGSVWKSDEWLSCGARLDALWQVQTLIDLTDDGWLTTPAALPRLEDAVRHIPDNPVAQLLLAEARLQRNLPQQCVEAASKALRLAPSLGRARYVRALAHWRLQQWGLAEEDLTVSLKEQAGPSELTRRLRARGAIRMLRRDYTAMCEDFSQACTLGDCEGLRQMRKRSYCLPSEPAASLEEGEPSN